MTLSARANRGMSVAAGAPIPVAVGERFASPRRVQDHSSSSQFRASSLYALVSMVSLT
jgi:hypothetical protein